MQSRPHAVSTVMGVLFALAGVAIAGAVAEVLRYRDMANRLTGYQQAVTEKVSQAGLDIEFTHLPAVAIGPTIMVVAVMVAIAAGLIALALALRLPRPRARVIAFITAGTLIVLAIARAGIALTQQLTLNQIFAEFQGLQETMRARYPNVGSSPDTNMGFSSSGFEDLFPIWPYYVDYLTSALAVVGCATVVVLLTRAGPRTWFAAAKADPSLSAWQPADPPPTPQLDAQTIVSDPWLRSIVSELLGGPRSLADLAAGPLGTNPEVLNWRLWDLCNAGMVRQSPSSTSTVYELTPRGESFRTMLSETG